MMKCVYCTKELSPSDRDTWETLQHGVQKLAIPRCSQCEADRSIGSRLAGVLRIKKKTPAMAATFSLDATFPATVSALDARARWTEQWKKTTKEWRNSKPSYGYYVHASDLGQPSSWPSGRAGLTDYFVVKFKEDPTKPAEALKAMLEHFEKTKQHGMDIAHLVYAHIGLIELRRQLWDRRDRGAQELNDQVASLTKRCLSCSTTEGQLLPLQYVACECHRLKFIEVFARINRADIPPEVRLIAPSFSLYVEVLAKGFREAMSYGSEVREALMADIETKGAILNVGAGPCFTGVCAEGSLCPICAHPSLVDGEPTGKLTLRRAIMLSETLWAFPPNEWTKGSLIWPSRLPNDAEVRQFDTPCSPMPPGSEYEY